MFEFMLVTDAGCFEFVGPYVTLGRDRRCSFVLPDSSVQPLQERAPFFPVENTIATTMF